jgi:peroxiredoxin
VELQSYYSQFKARGAEIVALAYQDLARAQQMRDLVQASYPILADAQHAVADAYGVFDLLGDGVATPAVFVIDRAGHVTWSYVGKDASDRPPASDVLNHVTPPD